MEISNYLFEEWRAVAGYEGLYEVSNYGRVRSLKRNNTNGKVLHQAKNNVGRLYTTLTKKSVCKKYQVSRLVAFAFQDICGKWFEGATVNHKNEVPTDNRATNLEWVTMRNNLLYGTKTKRQAEKVSKPILQFDLDGNFVKRWKSGKEIERTLGFASSNISAVCRGKYNQRYNFMWRFGD